MMNSTEWLFQELNKVSDAQYEVLNAPYIGLEVWYTPINNNTAYRVSINLKPSADITADLKPIVSETNENLSGQTFSDPKASKASVNEAIQKALQKVQGLLGETYAPRLAILYGGKLYLQNQTITTWQRADEHIELEVVDKTGTAIQGSIVWTNADGSGGNRAKYSIAKEGKQTVTVASGSDKISVQVEVKKFSIDPRELLKRMLIEVLTSKQTSIAEELTKLRKDSVANATRIGELLGRLERDNFPIESGGVYRAMYAQPLILTDTVKILEKERGENFTALRQRKAIRERIKRKLNVRAFVELAFSDSEKQKSIVDELIKNSGKLIADLIIGQPGKEEEGARNIVLQYVNETLERIANVPGEPAAGKELLLPPPVESSGSEKIFRPNQFLYISEQVPLASNAAWIQEIEASLKSRETPLYVFINYSQDISPEGYIQRAKAGRPKGIPAEAAYKLYTIIHLPGSVEEQVMTTHNITTTSTATTSAETIQQDLMEDGAMSTDEVLIANELTESDLAEAGYDWKFYINSEGKLTYRKEKGTDQIWAMDQTTFKYVLYNQLDLSNSGNLKISKAVLYSLIKIVDKNSLVKKYGFSSDKIGEIQKDGSHAVAYSYCPTGEIYMTTKSGYPSNIYVLLSDLRHEVLHLQAKNCKDPTYFEHAQIYRSTTDYFEFAKLPEEKKLFVIYGYVLRLYNHCVRSDDGNRDRLYEEINNFNLKKIFGFSIGLKSGSTSMTYGIDNMIIWYKNNRYTIEYIQLENGSK